MKLFLKSYAFLVCFTLLILGCTSTKTISNFDELIYEDKVKDLNPLYRVYHGEENESELYFKLNSKELLYVRENISQPFAAKVNVFYSLYNLEDKKTIIDSASNILVDQKKSSSNKTIVGKIPIKMELDKEYILKVRTTDVNKKVNNETEIIINKKNQLNEQFFLVMKADSQICFTPFFTEDEELIIQSDFNANKTLEAYFYEKNNEIAKPPFSDQANSFIFPEIHDSTSLVRFSYGKSSFTLLKEGIYSFGYNQEKSFTLHYLENNFPEIINHEGMIAPIRFICTNNEYKTLNDATDKRKAVEDFWMRIGGSKERARLLIKEFYKRIILANKYFTSYKEGWRTDRGMLSIVMGLPNTITKTNKGETWIYGTASNMMMSLSFTFNKRNQAYIENDFQLDRYRSYKDYWYRAVESWRQGRVYSFN